MPLSTLDDRYMLLDCIIFCGSLSSDHREMFIDFPSDGFYSTGIYTDIVQVETDSMYPSLSALSANPLSSIRLLLA